MSDDFDKTVRIPDSPTEAGREKRSGGSGKSCDFRTGDIIADRYQIISLLGEGGMGAVYRAEQIYLKKHCALKTLLAGIDSEIIWLRFKHEAQAASGLDHPNLIKVHDFGLINESQPFLVMDLAEGLELSELIKAKGTLDLPLAYAIFAQVCRGLEYAHSKGVIHRDIKPGNIIVSDEGTPKMRVRIVDFGIAKHTFSDRETLQLTRTGEVFGTPLYISPEQSLGKTVDDRSDIYSVGCVMYEALTGLPPFISNTALGTLYKQQNEKQLPLKQASLGKDFPDDLERIIVKLLQKDPRNRYSSIGQVALDLESLAQGKPISLGYENTLETSGAPRRWSPLLWVVAAAGGLILLFITFIMGVRLGKIQQSDPGSARVAPVVESPLSSRNLTDYTPDSMPPPPVRFSYPIPGSKFRLFDFGRRALGSIKSVDNGGHAYSLIGGRFLPAATMMDRVLIDQPFRLIANQNLALNPGYFAAFKDGEVTGIEFDKASADFDGQGLRHLAHLTDLDTLRINIPNGLNASSLQVLNRFGKLTDLALLGSPKYTVDWLAELSRLNELTTLSLRKAQNCAVLLSKLAQSTKLRALTLTECNLSSELKEVGAIKSLQTLDLSFNPITDQDLISLKSLPDLVDLNLAACNQLTPACVGVLKALPLKHLTIVTFSSADDDKFRKEMPPEVVIRFSSLGVQATDAADVKSLLEEPETSH